MLTFKAKGDLLEQWVQFCLLLCGCPRLRSTADRKIVSNVQFEWIPDDSLTMFHAGYDHGNAQSFKHKQLIRYYLNEDSRARALADIVQRATRRKYGSVGFSTYGHEKKGFTTETQCIQGVTVTHVPGQDLEVDVWYRTTDALKKFAADLVFLRDVMLPPFAEVRPIGFVRCHMANVTVDPGSFWLLLPHLENTETFEVLQSIQAIDPRLWRAITIRLGYYLDNREIKFDRFNRNRPFFYRVTTDLQRDFLKEYIRHERSTTS